MKRVLEVIGWLTAVALFAFAGHAVLATAQTQRPNPRDGEVEQRVVYPDFDGD